MSDFIKNKFSQNIIKDQPDRVGKKYCGVRYDPKLLINIPIEVLQKDFGCGDPTTFVKRGDVVLDLGSGSGKMCFILAQIVGPEGKVIGIDFSKEMIEFSTKYKAQFVKNVGYNNIEFKWGKIEDLSLNLNLVDEYLNNNKLNNIDHLDHFEQYCNSIRLERPLIENESIDVVVSNCVLNLVQDNKKIELFREIYRVLKQTGKIAISDIVSDEDVTASIKSNQDFWTGCIAGCLRDDEFVSKLEEVGFLGVTIEKWDEPRDIIEDIEFRSVTIQGIKGIKEICLDRNQAVIYRGPFVEVKDNDGHVFYKGKRIAVCDKTFKILKTDPYRDHFIHVEPRVEVEKEGAPRFDCTRNEIRASHELKQGSYIKAKKVPSCC